MDKVELGKKCVCHNCGTRFYDLNKVSAACPRCGIGHQPPVKKNQPTNRKTKPSEAQVADPKASSENVIIEVDELEEIETDVDPDEELMEDTSDLGENGDDIPEVKDANDIGDLDK